MPLFELENIHKHYHLGQTLVPVLKGINLRIDAGEMLAIGGPSGSGKTTLCNLLGLLDEPSKGKLFFQGQQTAQLNDSQSSRLRNHTIGFVFQTFNLIPVLSALENVSLPLHIQNVSSDTARRTAAELLEQVGLSAQADHRPDKLSGGQQQRVALARALVTRPALVIADEPTANLDSVTAMQILDLMHQLNHETDTSFIFASHDERLLSRVGRRLILDDGQIISDLTTAGLEG